MHDPNSETSHKVIDKVFTPFILGKPLHYWNNFHEKFGQTNLADFTSPVAEFSRNKCAKTSTGILKGQNLSSFKETDFNLTV